MWIRDVASLSLESSGHVSEQLQKQLNHRKVSKHKTEMEATLNSR